MAARFLHNESYRSECSAAPTLHINRQPAHLLDCTSHQVGTVVPQGVEPPRNTSADIPSRSAKAASPNMPMFFVGTDRISRGLPLSVSIAEGDRVPLKGAGSPAQIGHGSTTYIRITVSIRVAITVFYLTRLACSCHSFSGLDTTSGQRR